MQEKDLKIGSCISISNRSDIIEGVITNVEKWGTTVRCLYYDSCI